MSEKQNTSNRTNAEAVTAAETLTYMGTKNYEESVLNLLREMLQKPSDALSVEGRIFDPSDASSEPTIESVPCTNRRGSLSSTDNSPSPSSGYDSYEELIPQNSPQHGNDVAESARRSQVDDTYAQASKMSQPEVEEVQEQTLDSWATASQVARVGERPGNNFAGSTPTWWPAQPGSNINASVSQSMVNVTDSAAHSEQGPPEKKSKLNPSELLEVQQSEGRSSLQETQRQSQVVGAQQGNNATEAATHSELIPAQQTSDNNISEQKTGEDSPSSP